MPKHHGDKDCRSRFTLPLTIVEEGGDRWIQDATGAGVPLDDLISRLNDGSAPSHELQITQAAGESADAVLHEKDASGMESSREGGKPSAPSTIASNAEDQFSAEDKAILWAKVFDLEVGPPHWINQHGKYVRLDRAQKLVRLLLQAEIKIKDADRMAAAVDEMVRRNVLDPRSLVADARLDYGKPFDPAKASALSATACRPEAVKTAESILRVHKDGGLVPTVRDVVQLAREVVRLEKALKT